MPGPEANATPWSEFDVRKVTLPPAEALTLPPACYTDPGFFALEMKHLFGRHWVCLGREEFAPSPGDYEAFEIADHQVLLVRDGAGRLHAFANVCRHRGTRLLDGGGNVRAITCPFHSWAYTLEGRLHAAPTMERTPGFEKATHGLEEYELRTFERFVFVRLGTGGPPLEAHLGDLGRFVGPYRLSEMRCVWRHRFEVRCNWKQFLEVFMEDYHLAAVHGASIGTTYASPNPPDAVNGLLSTMLHPHEGTGALLPEDKHAGFPLIEGLLGKVRSGSRYTLVYPGFAFACTMDCMWFFEIYPKAPGLTEVSLDACFPLTTMALPDFAERLELYKKRWRLAIGEDNAVLEKQWKGLASPRAGQGRYSDLEAIVGEFGRWIAEETAVAR